VGYTKWLPWRILLLGIQTLLLLEIRTSER